MKPDSKGRINLGNLTEGIDHFKVFKDDQERLVLEPYTNIPLRELWLFKNKQALQDLKEGLEDAEAGRIEPIDPKFLQDID